jgi:hypothetical protein
MPVLRHAHDNDAVVANALLDVANDVGVEGFHDGERGGGDGPLVKTGAAGHGSISG